MSALLDIAKAFWKNNEVEEENYDKEELRQIEAISEKNISVLEKKLQSVSAPKNGNSNKVELNKAESKTNTHSKEKDEMER